MQGAHEASMLFKKGVQLIGLLQRVCEDDFGKADDFSKDASELGFCRTRIPVRLEKSATKNECLWARR
jgi:hypothetical protein